MRKAGFGVVLLICAFAAQRADAKINEFKNSLATIKLYGEVPDYELVFMNNASGKEVVWKPNVTANAGIDITINGVIGFGLARSVPKSDEENLKNGKTEATDYRFSLAFRAVHVSLDYQKYKGFYIPDSGAADPAWVASGPYIADPDMKAESAFVGVTWVLSPESFSLGAAMDQTKRQEESGGSFLLGLSASQVSMTSDGGFIPTKLRGDFGDEAGIDGARFQAASLRIGYGYTLVIAKAFYLSAALQLGGGPQRGTISVAGVEKQMSKFGTSNNVFIGAGYNGDTYFVGVTSLSDSVTYQTDLTNIPQSTFTSKAFVGMRF